MTLIGIKKFLPRPPSSLPRRGARLLAVSVTIPVSWAPAASIVSAMMPIVVAGLGARHPAHPAGNLTPYCAVVAVAWFFQTLQAPPSAAGTC
jgi:hypothetical protein